MSLTKERKKDQTKTPTKQPKAHTKTTTETKQIRLMSGTRSSKRHTILSKRRQAHLATCCVSAHLSVMELPIDRLLEQSMRSAKKCWSWKRRLANCTRYVGFHLHCWGGPLWRDRFLLWFLDPKLVPTKITFFPFREGARSWENQ